MENLSGNVSSPEYNNVGRDILPGSIADMDPHTRPYFCNVCNVVCSGFACYQQHLEGVRHRRNEAPSSHEFSCTICNISVNSEEQLNYHRHGTKHQRRAARQPLLMQRPLPPPSLPANPTSIPIDHSQFLGAPCWYSSPPSHVPFPHCSQNTNNHAAAAPSSSLNNDAGGGGGSNSNSFLQNPPQAAAPYSLSVHSSLPDLLSLLPGVMDDLSSAVAAAVTAGESDSRSVDSVSLSTPCFLASSVAAAAASAHESASPQSALQSLLQETVQEIARLEQQLARNLTRYRSSPALIHRQSLKAAGRRRVLRRPLGKAAASFRLSALRPSSFIRKSMTSTAVAAGDLKVPSIDVEFCRHAICLSLRGLLNYKNGLKRSILHIRRRCPL